MLLVPGASELNIFFSFDRGSFSLSDASKFLGIQLNWYFTLGKEEPDALASITTAVGS